MRRFGETSSRSSSTIRMIDPTDIAVSVKDGTVTLTGFVRSYSQRYQAERAAKRVAGVVALANDLEVRLPDVDQRPDPEIAREAVQELKGELPCVAPEPQGAGEGRLDHAGRRGRVELPTRARRCRRCAVCAAAKGVINLIKLKAKVAPADVKKQIEAALKRSAEIDAQKHHRRDERQRGDPARDRALLGGAPGSRTCGMGRARRDQGREPDHHQLLADALRIRGAYNGGRDLKCSRVRTLLRTPVTRPASVEALERHVEALLDQALDMTFPASDPLAVFVLAEELADAGEREGC